MWRYKSNLKITGGTERCKRVGHRRKRDLNNTRSLGTCVLVNGVFIDVAVRKTHLSTLNYTTLRLVYGDNCVVIRATPVASLTWRRWTYAMLDDYPYKLLSVLQHPSRTSKMDSH